MKKYLFVILPLLAILLVTSVVVRFSYTDIGDKYADLYYSSLVSDYDKNGCLSLYDSYDNITGVSDLIIKCKVLNQRIVTDEGFLTPVKVECVYKGNPELLSKNITILENLQMGVDKKSYFIGGGYIPLEENETYILCLAKKSWDSRKNLTDYEKSQYSITSESAYGVYRLSKNKQGKLFQQDSNETINTLKGLDIMSNSQDLVDRYYNFKEEIFKKYNINN